VKLGAGAGCGSTRWLAASGARGWQLRLSAGTGSKGHRRHDWLLIEPGSDHHVLLVRLSSPALARLAYYICHNSKPARARPGHGDGQLLSVRTTVQSVSSSLPARPGLEPLITA
jgi:hypothetical protein